MVQIVCILCYFPSIISLLPISLHFCDQNSIHRGPAFWNIVWTHVLSELGWQNGRCFMDLLTLKLHLYLTVTSLCVYKFYRVQIYGLIGSILSNIQAEHDTLRIVPALKDAGSKR